MDLSKLPRLSDTGKQAPQPPPPEPSVPDAPPARPLHYRTAPREDAGIGPEVFINVVIGALVIYMGGWPLIDYIIHATTGRPFGYPVTGPSGPVPYLQSVFLWQNLGALLFGAALILYGILGRSDKVFLSWTVLLLLWLAAAVNTVAVLTSLSVTGLPILQALCAAFGIYLGMHQWARVRARSASV